MGRDSIGQRRCGDLAVKKGTAGESGKTGYMNELCASFLLCQCRSQRRGAVEHPFPFPFCLMPSARGLKQPERLSMQSSKHITVAFTFILLRLPQHTAGTVFRADLFVSAIPPYSSSHSFQILPTQKRPLSRLEQASFESMADATSKALATNEVLCMILEPLAGRKLFTIQCVCKRWKAMIESSPTLQWKMFLRAKGPPLVPCLVNAELGCLEYDRELELNRLVPASINAHEWEEPPRRVKVNYETMTWWRGANRPSSCDKMFLTQPPCTIAESYYLGKEGDHCSFIWYTVRNSNGLRFEDMILANEATHAEHLFGSLSIGDGQCFVIRMPISKETEQGWKNEEEAMRPHAPSPGSGWAYRWTGDVSEPEMSRRGR